MPVQVLVRRLVSWTLVSSSNLRARRRRPRRPRPRRGLLVPLLLATVLTTALSASPTFADESGAGVSVFGLGSFARANEIGIGVSAGDLEPDPLLGKNFRLDEGGHLFGGGAQALILVWGIRFGFSLSVFGLDGVKLRHAALDDELSVTASGVRGTTMELFGGYERAIGPVRPYADLVFGWGGAWFDVDLSHSRLGAIGRTEYGGWLFGIGLRTGIRIPFLERAFVDLSTLYSLGGLEQFRVATGVGLMLW